MFIECYDKTEYNRATSKQATTWFGNIVASKQEGTPAPPVYLPITLPSEAFVGLEKFCRDFAGLMKKQFNYDKAEGLDLMIEREKPDDLNLNNAQPELKISVADTAVGIAWKKSGFDALELQFRKPGATMWQAVDKSTVSEFEFTPPLTTPACRKIRASRRLPDKKISASSKGRRTTRKRAVKEVRNH
jgi:hypothetical protein